jgi:hypothetical protein
MSDHKVHADHRHVHGPSCGHRAVSHNGHVDYLHDGHLHTMHGDHVDECTIAIDGTNPATCTSGHRCSGHAAGHVHGANCGHDAVPHGDHVDYLVDGHLHHVHNGHCDDHGVLAGA